jgi:ABC-type transport system involved in cytochrome bd biosynthesis fused ATPase/permease subunit
MLCLVYVVVAVLHGSLKLVLSVYRGSVSEAANQRLRMRIDPTMAGSANANGSGEKGVKVSIVVAEVEAVGGFVGASFCDPLLNAGILISVFGYMLVVQPWLALVAALIFIPQLLFIPFLQNAINLRTQRRIEKRQSTRG